MLISVQQTTKIPLRSIDLSWDCGCATRAILKIALFSFCLNHSFVTAQDTLNNITPLVGSTLKAQPFKLIDVNNKLHQLSDYKGKILIVNFWASWCTPCLEEIPAMNRAYMQLRDKNVAMLAINFGEDKETVNQFLKKYPIDFDVLLDESSAMSKDWKINALPTTVIINPRSEVIDTLLGSREWDSEEIIAAVLSIK